MIPAFRISDALRGIVFHELKGPNLACSRRDHFRSPGFGSVSFWKDALIHHQDRVTKVWRDGPRLGAAGSARICGGPKVWELDHLYLRGADSSRDLEEESYPALLDSLVQSARERGAERVFLTCLAESQVSRIAQRAGFFRYFNESLLEHDGSGVIPARDDRSIPALIRDRLPQDTHGLFQLFSAATPQRVRTGLGFTLDQWRAAQPPRHGREWVACHNDRLTGWAALWDLGAESIGEVMIHPDHPELLPEMLGLVFDRPGPQRWMVPDYQETIMGSLFERGFQETVEYAILAKTVAVQKFSHGMAAVEV